MIQVRDILLLCVHILIRVFLLVLQTSASYLVLVSVEHNPDETPYKSPPLAPSAQRHFLPGPGEALPFQSISLRFEGVIRVEGQVLRYVVPSTVT